MYFTPETTASWNDYGFSERAEPRAWFSQGILWKLDSINTFKSHSVSLLGLQLLGGVGCHRTSIFHGWKLTSAPSLLSNSFLRLTQCYAGSCVGNRFCKPLQSGADQNPAAGKGKPMPWMCVDFSEDQLPSLSTVERIQCDQFTINSWFFPLKDGAILSAQPWEGAGRLDVHQGQELVSFWGVRSLAFGPKQCSPLLSWPRPGACCAMDGSWDCGVLVTAPKCLVLIERVLPGGL